MPLPTESLTLHIFDLDKIMGALEENKYPGTLFKIISEEQNLILRDMNGMQIASITKTNPLTNEEVSKE